MITNRLTGFRSGRARRGFTLAEVVMAICITGVIFGGVLTAYVQAARRAEWSGYSLAAQALALQQLEQARAAKWDPKGTPPIDQTTNLNGKVETILDLPVSGNNVVRATNFVSVSTVNVSANPVTQVKLVRVNTVWSFRGGLFTNSITTYRAPDQ